jgi:alanyl-tRNA synthetase
MLIYYGQRPNELMVKRVAMLGCSALVLVHSLKESKRLSRYAGILLTDEKGMEHSVKRSIALLLGRILMSFLFIYVGLNQIKRVMLRDMALWSDGELLLPFPHRRFHRCGRSAWECHVGVPAIRRE